MSEQRHTQERTFCRTKWIYLGDQFVQWEDANIHVLTTGLQYAACVIDGITVKRRQDGRVVIFRLEDHIKRLLKSAKFLHMDIDMSVDKIVKLVVDLVKKNGGRGTYIRPAIYGGIGELMPDIASCRPELALAYWDWTGFPPLRAFEEGIPLCISPYRSIPHECLPVEAKASSKYSQSLLVVADAKLRGCVDGIRLDENGNVCETSGANICCIRGDTLCTPPASAPILLGVTRDTVLWMAKEVFGLKVREENFSARFLTGSDGVFLCGTASDILPIDSIDGGKVGNAEGSRTIRQLQEAYLDLILGRHNEGCGAVIQPPEENWLTICKVEG